MLYCRLSMLISSGRKLSTAELRGDFFDRTLGEYDATTDIPAAWFALHLLQAYPNAKVILNRRRDLDGWKTSFHETVLPVMQSWKYWLASWFNAELFWLMSLTDVMHNQCIVRGDFELEAKQAYSEHYAVLEAEMRDQGREWLDWSVEDGWYVRLVFLCYPTVHSLCLKTI